MQNNILTISVSDRIVVSPKFRLEKGAYYFMKRNGWKYSPSRSGFVFNVNEEGAKRVRQLLRFDPSKYSDYSFGSSNGLTEQEIQDAKDELSTMEFTYEGNAQEIIDKMLEKVDAEAKAQAEHKEQREERISASRTDRFLAIKKRLDQLKNGFTSSIYDLSLSNFNMSDLLARKGVRQTYSVKELCETYGLESYEGAENDILEFSIHYRNIWASRWSDKVAARRLMLACSHYSKSKYSDTFIEGGSGHFIFEFALLSDEPKIDFKKVITASEIADDEYKKAMTELYLRYRNGECLSSGEQINSLGMVSQDEVYSPALTLQFREKFDRAMA